MCNVAVCYPSVGKLIKSSQLKENKLIKSSQLKENNLPKEVYPLRLHAS